eukprot:gnl/TRDRNA2_/TRDRNA2_199282_c0_seq1.p1 gnl/TRDRNA2_/TRDRNA2_199282_c0~~gnl/TRDRNA2_/TRDRNA2_199282_c0_seq1.p1  ORF type:complete len:697 (+),score=113.84 gnl/TRDRNA2_/TRDRNA2_199282_c0_seq1:119-2209(+)
MVEAAEPDSSPVFRHATEEEQLEQLIHLTSTADIENCEEMELDPLPLPLPLPVPQAEQGNSDAQPAAEAVSARSSEAARGVPNSLGAVISSDGTSATENGHAVSRFGTDGDVVNTVNCYSNSLTNGDIYSDSYDGPDNGCKAIVDDAIIKSADRKTAENERCMNKFKGEGAECSICFAGLPSQPVCVLRRKVYGSKRACRHYFHTGCVQLLIKSSPAPHQCPLCRAEFEDLAPLPDVRLDSRAWFHTVDTDQTGTLEKTEVVDALSATLPVEPELLASSLEGELWDQWDTEHNGRITLDAFEHPARGLLQFVLYSLPSLQRQSDNGSGNGPVPDFVSCREGWFRYWDVNAQHCLPFLSLLRALVRSLRLDGACEDTGTLRTVLSAVWRDFGLCEAEKPQKPVSLALFCEKPDGFCDCLVDALEKEFGQVRWKRIRRRAHLLQQPAGALKRELKKLKLLTGEMFEKDELVEAIVNAEEALAKSAAELPPVPAQPLLPKWEPSQTPVVSTVRRCEHLKALRVTELQKRLDAKGVPRGHCLERQELEDLLMAHGDYGDSPLTAEIQDGGSAGSTAQASPAALPAATGGTSSSTSSAENRESRRAAAAVAAATVSPGSAVPIVLPAGSPRTSPEPAPEGHAAVSTTSPCSPQVNAAPPTSSGPTTRSPDAAGPDSQPDTAADNREETPIKRCMNSMCVVQ